MTVREFTSHMWYAQKVIVIKWKEFDKCNNIDDIKRRALMVGENCNLRSTAYEKICEMLVDSYGAIGDTMIIEVH